MIRQRHQLNGFISNTKLIKSFILQCLNRNNKQFSGRMKVKTKESLITVRTMLELVAWRVVVQSTTLFVL